MHHQNSTPEQTQQRDIPTHPVSRCRKVNTPLTNFTEIIHPPDPGTGLFDSAKLEELNSLIDRGTFRIVLRSKRDEYPSFIPSRYDLGIKHGEMVMKSTKLDLSQVAKEIVIAHTLCTAQK